MIPETVIMYCLATLCFLVTAVAIVFTAAIIVQIIEEIKRMR